VNFYAGMDRGMNARQGNAPPRFVPGRRETFWVMLGAMKAGLLMALAMVAVMCAFVLLLKWAWRV